MVVLAIWWTKVPATYTAKADAYPMKDLDIRDVQTGGGVDHKIRKETTMSITYENASTLEIGRAEGSRSSL
ncbi:hypothetical protein BofuT4_uP099220.1 [Botrytis cinerea T4]|uniref:Uncharacterized protein n=1 Tax=Botryotinia fuckeliana (strain T4) TaxID=999810 RepID=G2YCC5_BOTF4|nr:hypothetical protein BofuT4_uP099220.1 [Botrytis cinerea T4]